MSQDHEDWSEENRPGTYVLNAKSQRLERKPDMQSRGKLIMAVADGLRPALLEMFEGVRDVNGMLLQPAHIRGAALNVAQYIVMKLEQAHA